MAAHALQKFTKNPSFQPPSTYRLGRGHMDFFVNKGAWLARRHAELVAEMRRRGFTVNFPEYPTDKHPVGWMGDWEPTPEALEINRQRIAERLTGKGV